MKEAVNSLVAFHAIGKEIGKVVDTIIREAAANLKVDVGAEFAFKCERESILQF